MTLPDGIDLKSMGRQWFADVLLSLAGGVVCSGVVAEGGRISRSQMIVDCDTSGEGVPPGPSCAPRCRLVLKYDTVTGSGVQTVERRGLIESYQVGNNAYMMLTTSNTGKSSSRRGARRGRP